MQDPKETFNNIEQNTEMALLQSEKIAESVDNLEPIMEGVLVKTDEMVQEMKKNNDKPVNETKIIFEGVEMTEIRGRDGKDGEKGDKGDTGIQGQKGDKGDKGEQGDKGDKGEDGTNGYDGRDGLDGYDGKDGQDGIDGRDGVDGKDGKDGTEIKAEEIKQKLESLEVGLDYEKLSNVPDIAKIARMASSKTVSLKELDDVDLSGVIQNNGKYVLGGGTGLTAVEHDSTLTGAGTTESPLSVVATSASDVAITVRAATTAALAGSPTYDNGISGVGATLTRGTNGILPNQDGRTLQVADRLLVKNQSSTLQNGVYEVTSLGSVSTPWVLTRTTDADTTSQLDELVVTVSEGSTNRGTVWGQQTNNPVVGTSAITFATVVSTAVTQATSGTQVAGQVPYWTGTTRQLSKGDNLFYRNPITKETSIGTSFSELTSGYSDAVATIYTGVVGSLYGGGTVISDPADATNFALNISIIGEDGKPNSTLVGGVRGNGSFLGMIEAGQHDGTYDKPYFQYTAQINGQGGGEDFRNILVSDAAGTRIKSDNLFLLDATEGKIRLRTNLFSSDWWDIPTVAGSEGYVLTAHGDGAEATWEPASGGSPSGSQYDIQINDGSSAFIGNSDLSFNYNNKIFSAGDISETNNHTWQKLNDTNSTYTLNGYKNIVPAGTTIPIFTGSGVDDFLITNSSLYSGLSTTSYSITIDGLNSFIIQIPTDTISGSGYQVGEEVLTTDSEGSGTIVSISQNSNGYYTYLILSDIGGVFLNGDIVTGQTSGTTGTTDDNSGTTDTFSWTDGVNNGSIIPVNTPSGILLSNGLIVNFVSNLSHTLTDNWTFDGTPEIITYGKMFNLDGINKVMSIGDIDEIGNGNKIVVDDGNQLTTLGDGSNGTSILINDATQKITFTSTTGAYRTVGLPKYADDTAAGVAGLTTDDEYQTDGTGAAPLNVAGIRMIKQ